MKIAVIGAGYVGLTTAACLAQIGHDVFCSESDRKTRQTAERRHAAVRASPRERHHDNCEGWRLRFGSTEEAIDWGNAIFICVGTPPLANGDADLPPSKAVARSIAKRAKGYRLIVEKSTVPVQTGAQLRKHLAVHRHRAA